MLSRILLFSQSLAVVLMTAQAFSPLAPGLQTTTTTTTHQSSSSSSALFGKNTYNSARNRPRDGKERSKRQERMGQFVRTELSQIIHSGDIKGRDVGHLDADLRKRISIIHSDVSPDLRQARITVSIRKSQVAEEDAVVDRRRAFSWLVQNVKHIRHSLAQRMAHMKTVPDLTFAQADVSAAVDVMSLIDQISAGNDKRSSVGSYGGDDDSLPFGMVEGMDFDEDGGEWMDEDDDMFMEEGFR